jgi:tetratricopeptide (TPR) repeat protein
VAILLVIRGCLPGERVADAPVTPPREVFDPHKPFALSVSNSVAAEPLKGPWLARELNTLLNLAGLHIAPSPEDSTPRRFEVRVSYSDSKVEFKLLAPDQVIEREQSISLPAASRLQVTKGLLQQLLAFLQITANPNTEIALDFDVASFEALMQAIDEITSPDARGFIEGGDKVTHAAAVAKLERIVRQHPHNPRALSELAVGYLSVGGPDHQSLLDLAEKTAQQAQAINQGFAAAHEALGLVALRRNQWVSARESLDRALALDADSLPTLEGLACLFANTGQLQQAEVHARRALSIQPQNVGARDCLSYAKPSTQNDPTLAQSPAANTAMVGATVALLDKDYAAARDLLANGLAAPAMKTWGEPLLDAAQNPAHISVALQKLTEATLEKHIASTQVLLAGVALRRSDFVFNRLSRLRAEREPEPTRVMWLPQAAFLRAHVRFERIVTEAELPAYWHQYGRPDICNVEPAVYGCGELPKSNSRR